MMKIINVKEIEINPGNITFITGKHIKITEKIKEKNYEMIQYFPFEKILDGDNNFCNYSIAYDVSTFSLDEVDLSCNNVDFDDIIIKYNEVKKAAKKPVCFILQMLVSFKDININHIRMINKMRNEMKSEDYLIINAPFKNDVWSGIANRLVRIMDVCYKIIGDDNVICYKPTVLPNVSFNAALMNLANCYDDPISLNIKKQQTEKITGRYGSKGTVSQICDKVNLSSRYGIIHSLDSFDGDVINKIKLDKKGDDEMKDVTVYTGNLNYIVCDKGDDFKFNSNDEDCLCMAITPELIGDKMLFSCKLLSVVNNIADKELYPFITDDLNKIIMGDAMTYTNIYYLVNLSNKYCSQYNEFVKKLADQKLNTNEYLMVITEKFENKIFDLSNVVYLIMSDNKVLCAKNPVDTGLIDCIINTNNSTDQLMMFMKMRKK